MKLTLSGILYNFRKVHIENLTFIIENIDFSKEADVL